jgi:prepilin-type processing-associated H-X9-DG protein
MQWVEEPTLLVTRFEYANLFHTITDWYSAYVSSRVTDLPNRPNVVFVDGHCKVCNYPTYCCAVYYMYCVTGVIKTIITIWHSSFLLDHLVAIDNTP